MPLMKRRSQKAFEHNVKAEMEAGKPQPQSLAIAYSVKRKAKKASGGSVESGSSTMNMAKGGRMMAEGGAISASNEKRPMPDNKYNDSKEVSQNSAKAPPRHGDRMLERIDGQARMNEKRGAQKISHPKMVPQSAYSVRMRDEEDDLMDSAGVNDGPQRQPPERDNEEGADRQGPNVPDMQDEHSTHRRPYAKGGQIEASDEHIHPDGRYEDDLQDLHPSHDEGAMMAESLDEDDQDMHGDPVPDMEAQHNSGRKPYAKGGHIQFNDAEANEDHDMELNPAHDEHSEIDSMDQPDDEAAIMHGASVAAAIMAKRKMMARGGAILSEDSMESDDSSQADLRRNAQEDANMEDKASFDALRKENYNTSYMDKDQPMDSNLHGDDEESDSENVHDKSLVDKIRASMKKRSPITR